MLKPRLSFPKTKTGVESKFVCFKEIHIPTPWGNTGNFWGGGGGEGGIES